MPNHVKNVVYFNKLKEEDIKFILQACTENSKDGEPLFNFDKIIPEPKTEKECPEDCIRTPARHVMEVERKTLV